MFRQTHVTHEGKGLDGDFKPGKREFDHRMEVQYICAFFFTKGTCDAQVTVGTD